MVEQKGWSGTQDADDFEENSIELRAAKYAPAQNQVEASKIIGHHSRKFSANEVETTRLRIQNEQKQLEHMPEAHMFSQTTKKMGSSRFPYHPHRMQPSSDQEHTILNMKESSSFRDGENRHGKSV